MLVIRASAILWILALCFLISAPQGRTGKYYSKADFDAAGREIEAFRASHHIKN